MKNLIRLIRILGIALTALIIFKGSIYTILFTYESAGKRSNSIDFTPPSTNAPSTQYQTEVLYLAQEFTNNQLQFSSQNNTQTPDAVLKTHHANCIGYAALYSAYFNWIAKENGLKCKAEHHIGKIYLFKYNLHLLSNNPFFANHDFVIISDSSLENKKAIDPTVSDYLGIHKVSIR